jgi:hypothetical protein
VIAYRKIAIKREGAREPAPHSIIAQLDTPRSMVFELPRCTGLPLLESLPLDRIVRSRCTHIVRDGVIMRNDVPLVGMIPEPAHIVDQLALMRHQRIVNGNDPTHRVIQFSGMGLHNGPKGGKELGPTRGLACPARSA